MLLARERTAQAIETLTEIMLSKKAPQAARVSAARELLDRGYGRAESSVHAKIETSQEEKPDFSRLTPEEREAWKGYHAGMAPLIAKVMGLSSESKTTPDKAVN